MNRIFASLASLLAICAWTPGVAAAARYTDAQAYCRALGTIDAPDRRWAGPKLPPWIARRMLVDEDAWVAWRCADGQVLACVYGANRRCDAKARTSRHADAAVRAYCHAHPDADFVPAVVSGHDDAVWWRCRGRRALAGHVDAVDARGYLARDWQAVTP